MSIRMTTKAALLAALALAALHATAADAEAGKKLASEVCAACHGADGKSPNPQFPHLAGQYRDYLEHSLKAYRSGQRKNAIMQGFAANLSDRDIANLALYFSQQPGLATRY